MEKNNTWTKFIIGALITVILSIGGAVWTTGESTGTQKEKVAQLEAKVYKVETIITTDHDLLLRMDVKLQNIEAMLKQMQDAKGK